MKNIFSLDNYYLFSIFNYYYIMTIKNKPVRKHIDSVYKKFTYVSEHIKEDKTNEWHQAVINECISLHTDYFKIDEATLPIKAQNVLKFYSKLLSLKTKRKTILDKIKEIEECIVCLSASPCDAFWCPQARVFFPSVHCKIIDKAILDIDIDSIKI
jgi:hypothetical protein